VKAVVEELINIDHPPWACQMDNVVFQPPTWGMATSMAGHRLTPDGFFHSYFQFDTARSTRL
jgi:hypothetical protein